MEVLETKQELNLWRASQRNRVGFFPTMGALHSGHTAGMKAIKDRGMTCVTSIFVNPTQFGPGEDFAKYPRTLEADLTAARAVRVDAVWVPKAEEMYPQRFSTGIEETVFSSGLCGDFRPGHFRGVATVVVKLLQNVRPQTLVLGMKDAQQFFVLKKVCQDLDLPVEVKALPTQREADGLALSSRNRYLTLEERERAPAIHAELRRARAGLEVGDAPNKVLAQVEKNLSERGFRVQYLEIRRISDWSSANTQNPLPADQSYLLATASILGTTRLIDNQVIFPELHSHVYF